MSKLIYCFGPLFSPEEKAGMKMLSATLEEAGFQTFLPQRDGLKATIAAMSNIPLIFYKNDIRAPFITFLPGSTNLACDI